MALSRGAALSQEGVLVFDCVGPTTRGSDYHLDRFGHVGVEAWIPDTLRSFHSLTRSGMTELISFGA
ncbi:esterase/lipase [Mesorhizobium soli]|jgi:hypothetical protein|nr:esterase/lipase [Mesorhizobium soli]